MVKWQSNANWMQKLVAGSVALAAAAGLVAVSVVIGVAVAMVVVLFGG